MISTVAVGTDGSETAAQAVAIAAEIARRFDAKVVLVSAFHGSGARQAADAEREWSSNPATVVREVLKRQVQDLEAQGLEVSAHSDEGEDAGEVIVRLAEECGADLLVVGSRGMHRRILGSVPNTVTHHAPCSVLVVKTT